MRLILLAVVQILLQPCLFGENPTKPYSQWSEKEAKRILAKSAWSKTITLTEIPPVSALDQTALEAPTDRSARLAVDPPRGFGADKGSGVHGEKEINYAYTVRLFSALPVRQGYVRLAQLKNKYDKMTSEDKTAFDSRTAGMLGLDTSQDIIVALELKSNDRQFAMELNRRLNQATRASLSQYAHLISDHLGRVALKDYRPPSEDGTGAKLVFAREIDGEPVVLGKDKEFKLEFLVPGTGEPGDTRCGKCHKLYVVWKVEDLIYDGQLAL